MNPPGIFLTASEALKFTTNVLNRQHFTAFSTLREPWHDYMD